MATPNLWGDLPEVIDIRIPRMVLAEQASKLQEVTKGALTCDVAVIADGSEIMNRMRIVAPSLGNYSVLLVSVMHKVIAYPCRIESPFLGTPRKECADENQLVTALQEILQATKTHKLISDLLAQIRAENSIAA